MSMLDSDQMDKTDFSQFTKDIAGCTACNPHLPLGPRPVFQMHPNAKILIAGQAPGRKVHETGVPFNDKSGERLRDWMGISRDIFYDPLRIAILPMGFCFPGTGKSGDLPPRKECADLWRASALSFLAHIELTLVIGQYAMKWHLPETKKCSLTETVKKWEEYWPNYLPLPHPSPRNNIWLKKNPWFLRDVVPNLKSRIQDII